MSERTSRKGNEMTAKEIKRLFAEMEEAERISDELDAAWEQDPENAELEAAWDAAYAAEHAAFSAVVEEVVKITGGAIDATTARLMLMKKRDEFGSLVARLAA